MSTPFLVRLALRASLGGCLSLAACSKAPSVDVRVSYVGLDAPASMDHPGPFAIGILGNVNGAQSTDRALVETLRDRFAAEMAREDGLDLHVNVFDDRGTTAGIRGGAGRLERDPGVHIAIVTPDLERARIAAELAPGTIVVCVGCARDDAAREGTFAFASARGTDVGAAASEWIVRALSTTRERTSRAVAEALRATRAPEGYACFEGAASASDPFAFRRPNQAIKK